jgi:hypothetical protein
MTRMLIEPREVPPTYGLTVGAVKHLPLLKILAEVAKVSAGRVFRLRCVTPDRGQSKGH